MLLIQNNQTRYRKIFQNLNYIYDFLKTHRCLFMIVLCVIKCEISSIKIDCSIIFLYFASDGHFDEKLLQIAKKTR